MKPFTSVTFVGIGQFLIASTFEGSIRIWLGDILYPKKTVFVMWNSLFSLLTDNLYWYNVSSTALIYFRYSARVLEKIRMLLR